MLELFQKLLYTLCMDKFFQISHNRDKYTKPIFFHSHDFYEIYFFVDGNVKYYIENESYTLAKGDVLVIPPGKIHRPVFEKQHDYERYVLWLFGDYISAHNGIKCFVERINRTIAEKNTRRVSFKDDSFYGIKALFDKLFSEFSSETELSQYAAQSCNILILDKILNSLKNAEILQEESHNIAAKAISYINDNVVNAPSLDQLADIFYVSKYYLSHKFKEYTRTTVHQYILMKKINLAKELLEKGNSPNKVCSMCGFSTYSNFYKVFTEQTGVSPRDYLKK